MRRAASEGSVRTGSGNATSARGSHSGSIASAEVGTFQDDQTSRPRAVVDGVARLGMRRIPGDELSWSNEATLATAARAPGLACRHVDHPTPRRSGRRTRRSFYRDALRRRERSSAFPPPDGRLMSVQLRIGDSLLHLADESPEIGVLAPPSVGGTPTVLALDVADAEAVFAQAVAASAEIRQPLHDAFWGRQAPPDRRPLRPLLERGPTPARRPARRGSGGRRACILLRRARSWRR